MFEFIGLTKLLAFALVILGFVHVVYLLIIKKWNYFSERNIVCYERGIPVFGTMFGNIQTILGRKSLPEYSQEIYQKYSDRKFVGMYDIGGRPSLLIRDPELVNRISIKDFDHFVNHFFQLDKNLDPIVGRTLFGMTNQRWRDMRSTLSPLFTGSKMRYMLTLMSDCARDFNAFIREEISSTPNTNSREYEISTLIMRLSNDIIGSTAFGLKTNTLREPDNEFYKMGLEVAYSIVGVKAMILVAFPKLAALFNMKVLTDRHDKFFRSALKSTIEERLKKKIVRNDMLNLLLLVKEGQLNDEVKDAEIDQDTGFATVSEFFSAKTSEKLKNWTDEDLLAQSMVFFLAGFAGLATQFCFLVHELALNFDVQERLHAEIAETQEQLNGKELTYEALQRMKYLDMVVSETFRKWPVVGLIDRCVNKQYLIEDNDGTKILLQPNDVVWFPIYALHRDPQYYPNPDAFDPERFADENKKNIRSGTYLPFGIGPRACIASRFALLQMKASIYHILLEFKIECSPNTQIPLKLKGGTNNVDASFFNRFTLRNGKN